MALHDLQFSRYRGQLSPRNLRFTVLTRYGLSSVFSSKLFLVVFIVSFLPLLFFSIWVYLPSNTEALNILPINPMDIFPVNGDFFRIVLWSQFFTSFLVTILAAPSLISSDLRNNAIPLYLSRPLSRWEYALGKFSVVAVILSAITVVPSLIIASMKIVMDGPGWLYENFRLILGIVAGSCLLVLVFGLLGLAVSAWIKRKAVAAVVFFGGIAMSAAMGGMMAGALRTVEPTALFILFSFDAVWSQILGINTITPPTAWSGWLVLSGVVALSVILLMRRIQGAEVVA